MFDISSEWFVKNNKLGDQGWIVYGSVFGSNFSTFNGIWKVPVAPSSYDYQLIYLFTGLEDSASDEIIQPVLQWGVSPGNQIIVFHISLQMNSS